MKKVSVSTLLLILALCHTGFSQDNSEKIKERKKIISLLQEKMTRNDFEDTTMMYAFAFKVKVIKMHNGQSDVKSIEVSDSSAYKLYKGFEFLNEIRYELFMKCQKEATFILPVAVLLGYPGTSYQHDHIVVAEAIQQLFFVEYDENKINTDEYIYLPGITMRTSTWVDE